jgi:endogenous inhibitor of DNA gyrase (YacG/DUF329 family)
MLRPVDFQIDFYLKFSDNFSMADTPLRKVKCPRCGEDSVFAPENKFRPFCSERCSLIDLGQWANEDFRIPTQDGSVQDLGVDSDNDLENE